MGLQTILFKKNYHKSNVILGETIFSESISGDSTFNAIYVLPLRIKKNVTFTLRKCFAISWTLSIKPTFFIYSFIVFFNNSKKP